MFDFTFWVSIVSFLITFFFIITEKINRSVIAFFGAITMVMLGKLVGFYDGQQILFAIEA